jgi:hypothetical protein
VSVTVDVSDAVRLAVLETVRVTLGVGDALGICASTKAHTSITPWYGIR